MHALWDFSMRKTLSMELLGTIYKVLLFLYLGVLVVVELANVGRFFSSFGDNYNDGPWLPLLMLIVAPIFTAALILATRLTFEFLAAIFRIAAATEYSARAASAQHNPRLF